MDKSEEIMEDRENIKTMEEKKLTIGDIAQALGVSKTTVSRAISGKGRIGEQTRSKVLHYIEAHHYSPNVVAKGLAQSKTYNLGLVLPGDSNIVELPFFQNCALGICQAASDAGYDVLISMVTEDNIGQLERAVTNRKIDGAILTRTLVNDAPMRYLKVNKVPFVAIGSTDDDDVVQIDNDHRSACRELTAMLLEQGVRKIALIGGDESYVVNGNRLKGFMDAFGRHKERDDIKGIQLNIEDALKAAWTVEQLLGAGAECIVCMDDFLCSCALNALQLKRIAVPKQVRIASFYDSSTLANCLPPVTSVRFDVEELGRKACELLLRMLNGEEVEHHTLLGYEVCMRESTGS